MITYIINWFKILLNIKSDKQLKIEKIDKLITKLNCDIFDHLVNCTNYGLKITENDAKYIIATHNKIKDLKQELKELGY